MNPTSTDSSQSIVVRAQREHEAALRRYTTRLLRDEGRAHDVVQEALLALGRQPEGERKAPIVGRSNEGKPGTRKTRYGKSQKTKWGR